MPYSADISRVNPSCFLFLIDQSGSMCDVLDPTNIQSMNEPVVVDGRTYTHTASGRTKAQGVADAINRLLQNIAIKCTKSDGVRDYFHVGVIGYGGDNTDNRVESAFSGELIGREVVPIREIANSPARIERRTKREHDGAGGLVNQTAKFPVWIDPVADGGTPMCRALTTAKTILANWIDRHISSFPPIVINITDGEATDGDPRFAAESLKSLATNDGRILLFNIHISCSAGTPIEFPDNESTLPDQFAKQLFQLSSLLPPYMQSVARQQGSPVSDASRCFAFNADMVSVIRFLELGTTPSNLR